MPFSASVISNAEAISIGSMAVDMRVESPKEERPPLDQLREHCALTALFDSNERFDAPRCAASTRQAILQEMETWANSRNSSASMFWLYGGAGAGKSAIAQTLAERFKQLGRLAASFFFSKTAVPARNDGNRLIPTLVFQLVETIPDLRPLIEDQIRNNLSLFSKSRESQWDTLLVKPLASFHTSSVAMRPPLLIIIDGLDECQGPNVQCDLLQIVASAIPHLPFPFRFLIASRPESHIVRTFNHHRALQTITVHRYDLSQDSEANDDIRSVLEQEFAEIRRVHVVGAHLGPDWPSGRAIDILVDRSSGHFIYASTVMRYIQSSQHRPDDRLQVILGLSPVAVDDRPYAQLDALYTLIFDDVAKPRIETIHRVFGILYLLTEREGLFEPKGQDPFEKGGTRTVSVINDLLDLKPGDLDLLFDPLRSLVTLDQGDFRVFHKSLFDYLLDPYRSGSFHLKLDLAHESVAIHVLKNLLVANTFTLEYFHHFAYHCYFSRYNTELKDHICSLDILYSNYEELIPQLMPVDHKHISRWRWVESVFYILRTLRRQDLHISENVHSCHIDKIMNIHSSIFRHTNFNHSLMPTHRKKASFRRSLLSVLGISKNAPSSLRNPEHSQNLDSRLESLFKSWRPHKFILVDIDRNIDANAGEALISREHEVFASFIKSQASGEEKYVARSAYVCSEHFIHSYHYVHVEKPAVIFLTYARHEDAASCAVISFPLLDGADSVKEYERRILNEAEKYLERKAMQRLTQYH